jgi:Ser/Thr protein kinase RdoA (MazF antagonist)
MTPPADDGTPLTGGRLTPGVVRIGDTVRRPASAASPFTAELLTLLAERGFTGAPAWLGRDEAGRDTFGYLPGEVPSRFQPWTDAQVAAAGALLRALHDATRDSPLTDGHPVVCHHDAGPNNTVFVSGVPVAFIDFDLAAPGDPVEDVAYTAWTWCVSSNAAFPPPPAQAAQLRVLADAYGLAAADRPRLVDAIADRQTRNVRFWQARLADVPQAADRIAWSQRERAYTLRHAAAFTAALCRCPGA